MLQPLVITVMGEQLNNFGGNSIFFDLSPPQIAALLKQEHYSISKAFQPTVLKFVYFGIGMLVANYVSQALWIYTSEVLCRVCSLSSVIASFRASLVLGYSSKIREGNHQARYRMAR